MTWIKTEILFIKSGTYPKLEQIYIYFLKILLSTGWKWWAKPTIIFSVKKCKKSILGLNKNHWNAENRRNQHKTYMWKMKTTLKNKSTWITCEMWKAEAAACFINEKAVPGKQGWWLTLEPSVLQRLMQKKCREFEARMADIQSSGPSWARMRLCLKHQNQNAFLKRAELRKSKPIFLCSNFSSNW